MVVIWVLHTELWQWNVYGYNSKLESLSGVGTNVIVSVLGLPNIECNNGMFTVTSVVDSPSLGLSDIECKMVYLVLRV